jgi:hypothetical protein
MKNNFFFLFLAFSSICLGQIQLQFVTVNQYGNNLYIDNVTLGNQFNTDIGVTNISNILPDTNYSIGSTPFVVAPKALIINVGKNNVTSAFNVTMTVTPGVYSSTKSVPSLNSGLSYEVIFDNITISQGTPMNITIATNLIGDENPANNTLNQYTIYLAGVQRKVLFEEWTSSTCGPCASNNPTIDAFISARFDSLTPIKYHMNWPSPGNDPMYAYNPTQNTDRRNYYGINSVPHVIMDGIINPTYPYSSAPSLPNAFYPRKSVGSPMTISVVQTRIPGDTIKADITIINHSPLKYGNYYLRVHAIERVIRYTSPPGTNGEKDFYDVFRKAYPTSLGTQVPLAAGTYNFTFKYKLDLPTWVDTSIYTSAFVQNDLTKEVINSGKSRNVVYDLITENTIEDTPLKPEIAPTIIAGTNPKHLEGNEASFLGGFNYQFFEGDFPPPGWSIKNPDNGLTFEHFSGANGPMFPGTKCVTLQFYSYSSTNRADTMYSKKFFGLAGNDSVKFNWAYCQYQSEQDRLIVRLSNDNGLTFPYTIFDKAGALLATAPASTSNWVPSSSSQWGTFAYSLNSIIPVELTSFNAKAVGNNVEVTWTTASETNNYGFEIQRKTDNEFITVGFIKGSGMSSEVKNYKFIDRELPIGLYKYRIRQVDYNGTYDFSKIVEVDIASPGIFALEQNYPNPFNPSTKIKFSLATDSKVTLKVFNLLGEVITTLINEERSAGQYEMTFSPQLFELNLNSGIYFYQLETVAKDGTRFKDTKKMIFLK